MGKEMVFDRITSSNVGFDLAQEAKNVSKALRESSVWRNKILENTARQIRTYESETLEDNVVSFYPCFFNPFKGKTKLFSADTSNEEFLIESQIDPLERDGVVFDGFKILQEKLGERKEKRLFLWISPKGPAGNKGIYKDINYSYHQIYLGVVEGNKSETYALKSDLKEDILAEWVNNVSNGQVNLEMKDPQDFLLHPAVISFPQDLSTENTIVSVLLKLKGILVKNQRTNFYKDIDIDILRQMVINTKNKQEGDVKIIKRELEQSFSTDKYFGFEEAKRAIGGQLYVLYDKYANEKGEVKLSGCAGGSTTINKLFGNDLILSPYKNIFSTKFRLDLNMSDQEENYKFNEKGTCVNCKTEDVVLGPCGICRPCDESIRRKNSQKAA